MGKNIWNIKTIDDYLSFKKSTQDKLKVLEKGMKKVPPRVINECLVDTLKKSVARAPIEEGHLRQSGHVTWNGVTTARGEADGSVTDSGFSSNESADDLSVFQIGFWQDNSSRDNGAGDVNRYAIVQHEHTEFNHPRGGQAKFLESAIDEDISSWKERIIEELMKELK